MKIKGYNLVPTMELRFLIRPEVINENGKDTIHMKKILQQKFIEFEDYTDGINKFSHPTGEIQWQDVPLAHDDEGYI